MSDRSILKLETFMAVADTIALLGTCDRKQVGCVITRSGRCVSWGFNGAPPGLPHCEENDHGWRFPGPFGYGEEVILNPDVPPGMVFWKEDHPRYVQGVIDKHGCRNATHAEANALAAAARQGISTFAGELFTTCSPCDVCSRLIIAAGITDVYYREEYRDRSGLDLLIRAGVGVEQI